MPDLIRHPASNARIPAFAGMTKVKIFSCRVNNNEDYPRLPGADVRMALKA